MSWLLLRRCAPWSWTCCRTQTWWDLPTRPRGKRTFAQQLPARPWSATTGPILGQRIPWKRIDVLICLSIDFSVLFVPTCVVHTTELFHSSEWAFRIRKKLCGWFIFHRIIAFAILRFCTNLQFRTNTFGLVAHSNYFKSSHISTVLASFPPRFRQKNLPWITYVLCWLCGFKI